MIIDIAKYSNSGGHQINEDSIYCSSDLFVVADGLGGHYGGENASAAAVRCISEKYRGDISDVEIAQLLEAANDAVNQLNDGSHTTLAAAFVSGERMRIANVGDSRVYIFRGNKVHTVTKDHSVCQAAVDMGEMSYDDIRFSDDRSRLLKVLGGEGHLNLKTKYQPVELCDGDAFLLCSDGFWEYVHEREMEADLLKADSAESWKRLMLKRQLLKAKNKGDNYSLICGIVHSERKLENILPALEAVEKIPVTGAPASESPLPSTIAISEEKVADNKKTGRSKITQRIIIALLIVLLLAAGAAAFWLLGGSKLFAHAPDIGTDESPDISISETSETAQSDESLPAESAEQSAASSEASDDGSAEFSSSSDFESSTSIDTAVQPSPESEGIL